MAKYKLQEMPDMAGEGKKHVFPKLIVKETLDTEKIVDHLQHFNRAVPRSVVTAVIDDLGWIMGRALAEGCNVKLDGIGTFSMAVGFDDEKPTELTTDDEKMTHRKIKVKNVNYKVDQEMLSQLRQHTDFERDMGGVSRVRRSKLSEQERIDKALQLIDTKGYMTLDDYSKLSGLSVSAASRDLKNICEQQDSPLTWQGKASHKVWVKK